MHFDPSNVSIVESGKRKLTLDYIMRFKEAMDAPDLPLNKKEETTFLTKLLNWKEIVFRMEPDEAAEDFPAIARVAQLTLDDDLRIQCQLFFLSYYSITKENNKYEQLFDELEAQSSMFNNEHKYWFYRQSGNRYLNAIKYRPALDLFSSIKIHEGT